MKLRTNKYIISWLLGVAFLYQLSVNPQTVYAQEVSGRKNSMDVTFVVDVSGSMRTNDPNQIALDMVKAFIDTVQVQNIRVGFVAYNDQIVTSASPVSMVEAFERERLKTLIDATPYSGNTDIGLGLLSAWQLMPEEPGRNRVIILVSDGESDLGGSTTGRTLEQSNQELAETVENCRQEGIPIYTVAFGTYGGSKNTLERIAAESGANTYTAQSPELLIEVLYDIFNHNLSYKIQKITTGMYAGGSQEIRCVLDEAYLNEIDILLISPQQVGESSIQYGESTIPLTRMSYYAAGKIAGSEIDQSLRELTLNTTTVNGQKLDIYVINYRNLEPILNIETAVSKNKEVPYEVYFRDGDGNPIRDEAFYQTFQWGLTVADEEQSSRVEETDTEIRGGNIRGNLSFNTSGEYILTGILNDRLGSYRFDSTITVSNTAPEGEFPDLSMNQLSGNGTWNLNDYFRDVDGDALIFAVNSIFGDAADIRIDGNVLLLHPLKSGTQVVELQISDGEAFVTQSFQIEIMPLWKAYWWMIVLVLSAAGGLLWKLLRRPKSELVQISEEKIRNRFNGKLNAYFTMVPGEEDEIPPLIFHLYKIKDNRLCLSDLLKEYPEAAAQLGLDQIYLIADEERKMILYHTADSTIMLGNSIACRRIQYSVSFGDVIYITAPNDAWDLELHYIAMIQ